MLNQRLDNFLSRDEWSNFDKVYYDLTTEDGLVKFARAECLNPQRIPAMMITKRSESGYDPLPNPQPGQEDLICGDSKLYAFIGLQTDYSEKGHGIITPSMITRVLSDAAAV